MMIERNDYLNQLILWKEKQIIKVVTGIRRCGKSTLLKLFQNYLLNNGIDEKQIISINFEDMDFEDLLDYKKLYTFIKNKLIDGKEMYIFLDEVQNVNQFEKVVDSLYVKDNIDIYITGSNSYLFSGQLATLLSGRYIEIHMLPLSFKEYIGAHGDDEKKAFNHYLDCGGFPYVSQLSHSLNQIHTYIEGIYNTVLLKDIEERMKRKENDFKNSRAVDVTLLKSVSRYLSQLVGSQVSIRNITNYFIFNGRKISPNTINDYVRALCEAYLYYPVEPIDINGKELLKSNKKYYIVDIGLRNYILPKQNQDIGFTIENIVFLELKHRGYEVYLGKHRDSEVDFVTYKDNVYTYYQVSASLLEKSSFDREISPLRKIHDNYEKFILTLDDYTAGNYEGIKVINLINWLLA